MLNPLPNFLVKEWHPTKNGNIFPDDVSAGSKKKIWWLGLCGHEWDAVVYSRSSGSKCPICANQRVLSGYNDLAFVHPDIASEWHPNKNGDLTPDMVMQSSSKKVWWLCKQNGHEYQVKIADRVIHKSGCSVCSNKKVVSGFNDLSTTHPDFIKFFHPTKNNISIEELSVGSHKKVWWLCENNHESYGSPSVKFKRSFSCAVCSRKTVNAGFNDVLFTHPQIEKLWHKSKNVDVTLQSIVAGTNLKVWWQCDEGHEWKAAVKEVVLRNRRCPVCSNTKLLEGYNDIATTHPHLIKQWDPSNIFKPNEVIGQSGKKIIWNCVYEHDNWVTTVAHRIHSGSNCPSCVKSTSKAELDMHDFIKKYISTDISQSNRKVLKGKEIDIYIPDKKIGIEFNGVYWHSESQGKERNYHYNKWLAAKEAGVQLIQIWEDDWTLRRPVVERMLLHKLGISTDERVFARRTTVVMLNTAEARVFLSQNHIQGFASGSYYVSLKDNAGTVVAVMVLKKEQNNVLNIIRYATSVNVVGGFTKLLSFATKAYAPDSFVTFADHTVSDGGLYENNGFVVDKELPPDYMYVYRNERKHKFGYRLKRFRDDPELKYVDGFTERELAQLNGLDRIWDAGKTKYMFKVG